MASIVTRNLSDQILDLVRDRIVSGQVSADLPIRQDALAAERAASIRQSAHRAVLGITFGAFAFIRYDRADAASIDLVEREFRCEHPP